MNQKICIGVVILNEKNKNSPLKNELLERVIEIFSEDLNETWRKLDRETNRYNIIEGAIVLAFCFLIIGLWFAIYKLLT